MLSTIRKLLRLKNGPASQRETFQDSPNTDIFPQHTPFFPQHFLEKPWCLMGRTRTFQDLFRTERVGVHIGPKTTARDGMGLTFRAKELFPLHFPLHNYKTSWDFKRRPLRDLLASFLGVSFLHSQQQGS